MHTYLCEIVRVLLHRELLDLERQATPPSAIVAPLRVCCPKRAEGRYSSRSPTATRSADSDVGLGAGSKKAGSLLHPTLMLAATRPLHEGGGVTAIVHSGCGQSRVSCKVGFIRIRRLKPEPSGYSDAGIGPLVSDATLQTTQSHALSTCTSCTVIRTAVG